MAVASGPTDVDSGRGRAVDVSAELLGGAELTASTPAVVAEDKPWVCFVLAGRALG
jgi:hypothetical protein